MAKQDDNTTNKIMEHIVANKIIITDDRRINCSTALLTEPTEKEMPCNKIVIPTRIVKTDADDDSSTDSGEFGASESSSVERSSSADSGDYGASESSAARSCESESIKTDKDDDGSSEVSVHSSENIGESGSSSGSDTEGGAISSKSNSNSSQNNADILNNEVIKNTMNNLNSKYKNRSRTSPEKTTNRTKNIPTNTDTNIPTHINKTTSTTNSTDDENNTHSEDDIANEKKRRNNLNVIPYDMNSAQVLNKVVGGFKTDDASLNDGSVTKGSMNSTNSQDDTGRYFTIIHDIPPTDGGRCKKCPKMQFGSLKHWWKLQQNLAPRSRHFLRISLIVLGSALLLLAIFLLARLPHARKDVSHPTMYDLPADDAFRPLPRHQDFTDTEDLPPLPQVDHPDVAAGGADIVRLHETITLPSGDVDLRALARRKGIGFHPSLGVPVDQSFLNFQAKRLMQRRRSNATVESVLQVVRQTVDAERKKMKNKEENIWTVGATPLRILLVSTWRSGSTFLGQVLQQHPGVFQHYEPFSYFGIRQIRSGSDAFQSQQVLHRLLECRFEGQDDYLDYTAKNPIDMSGHNKRIWKACSAAKRVEICSNATFLTKACNMFPIQLVKTVRLRLNLTQLFLGETRLNAKVVFLARDPRATMSSRRSSVAWCDSSPDCSSSDVLCSDLKEDLKVSAALELLYPKSFTMIKYEDLANNPQDVIKKLLQFLGMEYSKELSKFVADHTQADLNKPWSIARKSAARVSRWKEQLKREDIDHIERACKPVIEKLGYEMSGSK